VHRAPQPSVKSLRRNPSASSARALDHLASSSTLSSGPVLPPLTAEALATLASAGVPAYRAMQTFPKSGPTSPGPGKMGGSGNDGGKARALVLGAQNGAGLLAAQLMCARGAGVTAVVPPASAERVETAFKRFGLGKGEGEEDEGELGVEIVKMEAEGGMVSVLEELWRAGRRFDFVLDLVGGKEVWAASEPLLATATCRCAPPPPDASGKTRTVCRCEDVWGAAQFTTLVGDHPERPVPGAQEHFKAGMRSLGLGRSGSLRRARSASRGRRRSEDSERGGEGVGRASMDDAASARTGSSAGTGRRGRWGGRSRVRQGEAEGEQWYARRVNYAWISAAADVDTEGGDVRDALAAMLTLAQDKKGAAVDFCLADKAAGGVVPFERAPELFRADGVLRRGEVGVVKVMG
jgi:hypothetical protein